MWKPIDTEFYVPRLAVSIVSVDDHQKHFVRTILEALNCVVHLHTIGCPADFLKVIAQGDAAPRYMIVMGHGTEDGLYFGDYGEPHEDDVIGIPLLKNGSMPPEAIRQHVNLPGCTVFTYSCYGGSKEMADAFLAGGADAYLGCRTGPNVTAMSLFLFHFLHNVMSKKLSDHDAWYRAVAATDHEDIKEFSFFHGDGTEERF